MTCGCWRRTRDWAGRCSPRRLTGCGGRSAGHSAEGGVRERSRLVLSPTAVFRYLDRFHDEAEESRRRSREAFIPASNDALRGLGKVNADLVRFAGGHTGHTEATLDPVSSTGQDMDATLIGTHKRQACYCYKKHKAYQPLTTYWA